MGNFIALFRRKNLISFLLNSVLVFLLLEKISKLQIYLPPLSKLKRLLDHISFVYTSAV